MLVTLIPIFTDEQSQVHLRQSYTVSDRAWIEPYPSLLRPTHFFHMTQWFLESKGIELVLQSYVGFEQVQMKRSALNVERKVDIGP